MSPNVSRVLISPVPLTTVMAPPPVVHLGVLPFLSTHFDRSLPSKSTMASDGGAAGVAPGVTTRGSGSHTSVSLGSGFFCEMHSVMSVMARRNNAVFFITVNVVYKICMPLRITIILKIVGDFFYFFFLVGLHLVQYQVRSEQELQLVTRI